MPIIIDGWNFIRDRNSPIIDDDIDALESAGMLVSYLSKFQETHSDPIVLVFDSTNEYLDMDYENSPGLRVVPARDADAYIKRYIEDTPDSRRRNIRVVSSDNDVYFYAKSYSATPIKCRDFWKKLSSSLENCGE